jgi:DNA repair protein RecN (Recombination protein N)
MLASLSIQNVVLIDRLNIDFRDGLCALTGETGAGKSILLDALGLALGARSESGLVRKGADAAQVTAEFHIGKNHSSAAILKNSDIEPDENLILRRSVSTDGRSRAFINDQPVSIGLLKQIGETLVEIHGQFETQGLLNPATHGEMLDEYAGIGNALSGLWSSWKTETEKFEQLKTDAEKSRNEETYLRQAVEDLDALAPKSGEESELSALRARLMNREQALEALTIAYDALNGENDPVRKASSALARVAAKMAGAADPDHHRA